MTRRRWDEDERGRGIASGEAFAANVAELADAMSDEGWVAEDPEAHLLPRLQAACEEPRSELRLERAWPEEATYVVELTMRDSDLGVGQIRRAAVSLAAEIAEESTHIRQRSDGDVVVFDIASGSSGDGRFAAHGHLVQLRIRR